ncbi:MAG TPA: gfo/Idh/MocA family oxidoreductase, partial [Ghiorsea sp.]|nr:gfo/Idh/MocA family oxidoreductase [Ghiorsea sp.]
EEIKHFSDCVLNGKKPDLSMADAKANCKTIVAALESVKHKTIIEL